MPSPLEPAVYSFEEAVRTCLRNMHADGFVPPLTFACITGNGLVISGRYTGEWEHLDLEWLSTPEHELQFPFYLTFVDGRGEAVGVLISQRDLKFLRWPSPTRTDQGH
jgi:hypothetical protein